jgi:hypothetical protein
MNGKHGQQLVGDLLVGLVTSSGPQPDALATAR